VYYNKKPPMPHDYVEMSARPLYAFGYGLSYTTFEYGNLDIKEIGDTKYQVTLDVTNTGQYDGDEVVQLYIHDEVASTAQPLMQLKKFERVFIPKGETRQVTFILEAEDLSIINADMQCVVELGDFTVMIGSSSDNILLKSTITVE
ncbi:MAG: fibronectin type III-like domain-contianing protein, partial [Prevotella sp.]|nr:fibronectin type III-like domain-contianing protein [Prevotella sp.]